MADAPSDGTPLVLVTGGASGIGAAAVRVLAAGGWRPLVVDIAPDGEVHAPALLWSEPVDISEEAAVEGAVAAIEAAHGPIAGLVNAAGILGRMHPPERLRMADWDREMAVDLRGTFLACRAVGPRMAARRAGAIVNVASVVGMSSAPVHGYGPAKAAVIGLTQTLAAEWGPAGVRVNAVSPGFTRTPALELGLKQGVLKEADLVGGAALRRLVEPAEVGPSSPGCSARRPAPSPAPTFPSMQASSPRSPGPPVAACAAPSLGDRSQSSRLLKKPGAQG